MDYTVVLAALKTTITASFNVLTTKVKAISTAVSTHFNDRTNPHGVNKKQVGLEFVPNWKPATKDDAESGVASDRFMTPERTAQAIVKQSPDKTIDLETKFWQGL